MSPLPRLRSYELSVPDTWAPIPVADGEPGWTADVAAQLCDGDAARAALADRLEQAHPAMIAEEHAMLGVWVPDRAVPDVAGTMTMDWLTPDESWRLDRASYRELIEPDPGDGLTVFAHYVDEVEVPAGPALLVREVVARRESRWSPWRKSRRT